MCGISGIISKNKIETSIIKSMNDTLIHRGPNDEGFLLSNAIEDIGLSKYDSLDSKYNLAFGHRRLSIVDLSPLGHQPMSYMDRYWIVYNGEIYNHIELRDELEALGYSFKSHTDTEVIMASFNAWGSDCLNRFNGMWAFILFDTKVDKLFISRDRFGVKPLYYYQDDNDFIFASEIKAILKHPKVKAKSNMSYIKSYLEDGPKEHLKVTAFEDILRFDNASYLEIGLDKVFEPFEERKFWELKPNLSNEKFDMQKAREYADRYYELLNDAVRLRLRADVKVGSALSGGLDSSSIVYLINQQLREQKKEEIQETFSCIYKTPGTEYCDESKYIDELASFLSVKSHQIEPKAEEVIAEHRKVIYHFENLPANTQMSAWHTYKLFGGSGVTVELNGQGADEQLAGYVSYLTNYFYNLNYQDIFREATIFWQTTGAKKYILIGVLLKVVAQLLGKKITRRVFKNFDKLSANLNSKLIDDTREVLGLYLQYGDRFSMAYSIESRNPFLDYRLAEFLASVPVCYKLYEGYTKYIARLAMDKKLPDEIVWNKDKKGWPIPEEFWVKTKLKQTMINKISASAILDKTESKADESTTKLIKMYNVAILEEEYFKE